MTCCRLLSGLLFLTAAYLPAQTVQTEQLSTAVEPASIIGEHDSVAAKVVSGDGWETDIILLNMGTAPLTFRQFFLDADGKPMPASFRIAGNTGVLTGAVADGSLNPGASAKLTVFSSDQPYREAWSVICHSGSQNTLIGYATLRHRATAGSANSETTLPLSTMQDFSLYLPFDNTQGFRTQLTLVNPVSNLAGQVRLTYRSVAGQVLLIDSFVMKPGQQTSIVIPDAYPDLANKTGTVFVEANLNRFSAVGIRLNERSGAVVAVPRLPFLAE